MSYINSSLGLRLTGVIGDTIDNVSLELYSDADFAGDKSEAAEHRHNYRDQPTYQFQECQATRGPHWQRPLMVMLMFVPAWLDV